MSKTDRECASRSVRKELAEKLGIWVLLGTEGGVLSQIFQRRWYQALLRGPWREIWVMTKDVPAWGSIAGARLQT